jgi:Reverse transcriptase (RNA-dependent DNA polymerase)/Group II intron, maturase-specific domain
VGGPVRAQNVRVPAGPELSGRDRGHPRHGLRENPRRRRILDAGLTAAFGKIDHGHLLAKLGSFPGKGMIRGWLKAGVFEKGKGSAPTDEGTPQGGVISPCLLNIALHGLEEAAGVRYEASDPARTKRGCPALVVCADDMVALCHTRQQAERVKARMAGWLAPRGLSFNEAKTRIVTLEDGFDFLGFTVRRHAGTLITRPGKAAVKRVKHRLAAEMRALRGGNAAAVLATINPIVRGWANYYRGAASSRTFAALDHYLWQLTCKRACYSHANKPKPWIVSRYYGRFNPASQDRWVFGNRGNGACLPRPGWTKIVRHSLVPGAASPDDPALTGYWAQRRGKNPALPDRSVLILLARQKGRCPLCGDLLSRRPGAIQPRRMGTVAPGHPQGDHQAVRDHPAGHGHTGRHPPSPLALPAPGNRRLKRTSTPLRLSAPWGLLEPYAATSGTYGSEGAPVQQCIGATQRSSWIARRWHLYPQLHAARGPSSWRRNRSPVTVPRASGENPGQDDPDAAGVLDLDSGPEMGTSPGSSNGPEPGRRPCPGTPWRSRPPRPRPPGRRRIRLPRSVRPLSRHHAERRER